MTIQTTKVMTTTPMEFDPPIKSPSELKVHLEPSERSGDEAGCYMQDEPVHKLVHFQNMRILSISAEGTASSMCVFRNG